MEWLVGIDEVGRGPLAGPVMVGAVLVPVDFDWSLIPGVTDSKKLSEKKREQICEIAKRLQGQGKLAYAVAKESAAMIDQVGIVPAIRSALGRALDEVLQKASTYPSCPRVPLGSTYPRPVLGNDDVLIRLDGGLKAPAEYIHQETIIKGDAKEPVIGLASIVAKVTRDRLMLQLDTEYPGYGFGVHKGYGTAAHRQALVMSGLSAVHRATFCRSLIVGDVQRYD